MSRTVALRRTRPLGALQVPFGALSTSQYIPLRFTNPQKWDLLGRTDTDRDILYGSEEPEVDGSMPSLTTGARL